MAIIVILTIIHILKLVASTPTLILCTLLRLLDLLRNFYILAQSILALPCLGMTEGNVRFPNLEAMSIDR